MEKIISHDHSITELGQIQVRQITRIIDDDGTEIAKTFHRHVVCPGDDVSNEDERTQVMAAAMYAPDFLAKYHAAMEDDVVTQEERTGIWESIKNWFK